MVLSNVVFGLVLAGAWYALIKGLVRFPSRIPELMAKVFVAAVTVMWILQLFGVGR